MKIHKSVKLLTVPVIAGVVALGVSISSNKHDSSHIKAASEKPNSNTFVLFKQEHGKAQKEVKKPFIKINKKEFSNKDYDQFKAIKNVIQRSNGNQLLSENKVKHEFIKENALLDEAGKQNLTVTKQDAEDFAKKTREQFDKLPSDNPTRQVIEDYIAALGISEDEYWTQIAVPTYEKALTIGKLKNKVFNNERMKNKNVSLDQLNTAWEKYQEEVTNKADVETLN